MSTIPVSGWHQPVMVPEVLHYLNPRAGQVIIDGTAGTGGHDLTILPRLLPGGRLVILDRDRESLELAKTRLVEFTDIITRAHGNYRRLPEILARLGIGKADGLLLDLGMSSPQVDQAERGFSFLKEGPLDMRMDRDQEVTAAALVNTWGVEELETVFRTLGEERFARRIAQQIIRERRNAPLTTTTQLAQVVVAAVPSRARYGCLHPATRIFQALRMAVNDELGALKELLARLDEVLKPCGRVVILTFHSLEDRLVKHNFLQKQRDGGWVVLTKKPECPAPEEVANNPRARSAKLRALERRA